MGNAEYNVDNYSKPGGDQWDVYGALDIKSGAELDVESGASLKLAGTALTASAAEINASSTRTPVNTTAATLSLTAALHAEKYVTVNKADGAALTLPAAAGTGNKYTVIIGTAITSNSTTVKAANANDSFAGMALGVDTDAEGATGYTWNADANDDTVTMDGTATGGAIGDVWTFVDYAANIWLVEGRITQSGGSEATPFSATVS